MPKGPIEPNAAKALNEMKYEIAHELGIIDDMEKNRKTFNSGSNVLFAGHVGGQMTRRLIEMAEKELVNKNSQNSVKG
ncbi:Small, acid-soluble spore protein, alpha/beta type [Caminicella sporogenes DSM 14501]|uniref:Small, acid-soluble spore protein, alpha/beta type n=1 Tax=Caminicella sporogenes DSM 14501 TaxID=1121266 RepID=A0A1M6PBX5_9FIRM|nr:alpha/beta-type small acid-soluble spore protein [Caminicella sporogenes]RKD21456.1 hypothetical protein BET04_08445 [Caminicella sporogenes]SHK05469.1 Small, acid-soluble spore protein, alpha/beta type [Caminicella sporogenes DSM 14501]